MQTLHIPDLSIPRDFVPVAKNLHDNTPVVSSVMYAMVDAQSDLTHVVRVVIRFMHNSG